MILCVDGHDIPILTATDLTKEQRALFTKPTRVPVADGHINALLVGSTDKATLVEVKGQTRLDLLVEVGRYRRRGRAISASMPSIRPNMCANRTWVMVGEMPVERSAQLILLLLYLCFTWINGVDLKVRIHGRPRSERKRSFLLSAVAPGTSTRHPRKARPINWAQRGGLASGGKYSADAEATFHGAIMHAW